VKTVTSIWVSWHAPPRSRRYAPLSGAAKYPAGARPSKCIIVISLFAEDHSVKELYGGTYMGELVTSSIRDEAIGSVRLGIRLRTPTLARVRPGPRGFQIRETQGLANDARMLRLAWVNDVRTIV
jgi:hypothetical protein